MENKRTLVSTDYRIDIRIESLTNVRKIILKNHYNYGVAIDF
jgi:hypothetical protein